jgi:hypothetical protein
MRSRWVSTGSHQSARSPQSNDDRPCSHGPFEISRNYGSVLARWKSSSPRSKSRSALERIPSYQTSFLRQSSGMLVSPHRAPASCPVTAATVSASSPRLAAIRTPPRLFHAHILERHCPPPPPHGFTARRAHCRDQHSLPEGLVNVQMTMGRKRNSCNNRSKRAWNYRRPMPPAPERRYSVEAEPSVVGGPGSSAPGTRRQQSLTPPGNDTTPSALRQKIAPVGLSGGRGAGHQV